jgi:hypothetical protein
VIPFEVEIVRATLLVTATLLLAALALALPQPAQARPCVDACVPLLSACSSLVDPATCGGAACVSLGGQAPRCVDAPTTRSGPCIGFKFGGGICVGDGEVCIGLGEEVPVCARLPSVVLP